MTLAQPFAEDGDVLEPGTKIANGRIAIKNRIARGGTSTVYAAEEGDQTIALKVISSKYASDPSICERFRNEVRIGQALDGISRVIVPLELGSAPELNDRLFMTMPLVRGTPLSTVADRNAWKRWVHVMIDLAETVQSIHEAGLVHRDIKPGNVILTIKGGKDVPYLLDFGFAHSAGTSQVPATAGLTKDYECPGTKMYMAPEQALGHPAATSFDIYALGLTAYELLAGMNPLEGMTPAEAVQRKCSSDLPSLSLRDHRGDLPGELLHAVDRALQRDPSKRTPTAGIFARELEAAMQAIAARASARSGAWASGQYVADLEDSDAPTDPDNGQRLVGPIAVRVPVAGGRRISAPLALGLGLAILISISVLLGIVLGLSDEPELVVEHDTYLGSTSSVVVVAASSTVAAPMESTREGSTGMEPVLVTTGGIAPDTVSDDAGDTAQESSTAGDPVATPPDDKATRRQPSRPKRPRPELDSAECTAKREAAADAASKEDWQAVLAATKGSTCWPAGGARRARVQALHGLGRFRECVDAARQATDTATRRNARLCEGALKTAGAGKH